ncbi:non-ribosomal peptide synthetase [Vallitalea sediminicola]
MENKERVFYNLTHPQKRIWYIDKINTNSPLHNIGGCLNIHGYIDVKVMGKTLNLIIKNNEGLRLRIFEKEGEPFQYVKDFQNEKIDFLDFSKYEDPEKQHKIWSNQIFDKKFDWSDNKLYYFAIYKIREEKYGILLNIYHIISDGWSISLIQKQICDIYIRLMNKEEVCTSDSSYLDFIEYEKGYLNSKRFVRNKNFWKDKLLDLPEEFLYKTYNSLEGKRQCFNIDKELSTKIKQFSGLKGCSLNTFFITMLLIYINKITYKNDIIIGTPVFNRINREQKNMIGMFTSTVPLRIKLDTGLKTVDLIKLVNRHLKECFFNQQYPYDLLIKDLKLGDKGYDSLYKMCVNYYNSKYDDHIEEINVEVKEYYSGNQSCSLQLTVKEWDEDKITINLDYKTLEYSDSEIKIMYEALINISKQVITDENTIVSDLNALSQKESNYKVYDLNDTISHYPEKTVCELFEEQAIKSPNNIALEFEQKTVTYKELNNKSNQLANYLKQKGINNKSVVAIMETHSVELMVSILASMKVGAAYLPIDPSNPVDRINYMLEDSRSSILLINFEKTKEIKLYGNIINIHNKDLEQYNKENLPKCNSLNDVVYIIYTSGSTGRPKGVMIENQGLTNYIWWANKMYLKSDCEAMALYSSISFDLTVTSIFAPLVSGNKIIIYDNDETEFILYKILRENRATVVKLTPAHLTLLKDMDNTKSNIRAFIVGGEDLKVNLAKEIYNSFGKNVDIYNEYGPTEAVVGCMIHKYDETKDKGTSVPIGHPADNVQIYILDKDLNAVLTGLEGEIYISGDGVARGYLNRNDLTQEKFIKNPFVKGQRMYKTGDTARYLADGQIEYVSRIDNQVKIRGHRIELGEIERYLIENKFVKDAVVLVKEDTLGNKILNGYVVKKGEVDEQKLKKRLLKFLPKYMIPTNFVFMGSLPLTINGKVNYSLLPDVVVENKEFVKYNSLHEKELVKAMEQILGIQGISMNDNYYQLGGDSIKAIQISSKLKNIGLILKVKDILSYDSIQEIAYMIEENQETFNISQDKIYGVIENTPIEQWFFSNGFKNEHLYNQYVLLEYNTILDRDKISLAIDKLIDHHDGLRINYDKEAKKLYYNDTHLGSNRVFRFVDLKDAHYDKQCNDVKGLIKEYNVSFNIENNLLFNVTMFQIGDEKQILLFQAHHLVVDGVSWRVILDDFITILNQLEEGNKVQLPMKTHSFKEWAKELTSYIKKDFQDERPYWENILNSEFSYPLDFNKGEDLVNTSQELTDILDEDTLKSLSKGVNQVYGMDLNEVLIIGLIFAINNATGNNDIVIELERHGRENISNLIDISRTVGWFTSMYPAYFNVEFKDIKSNLKSLKEQLRNIPSQGFNYGAIRFLKNELEDMKNKPIRFNYLGDLDNIVDKEKFKLSNIEFGLNNDEENALTALIDVVSRIVNKKLKINITFSKNRFSEETIQTLIDDYIGTLRLIEENCRDKDEKEFTPSDFETVNISQDDLDALFS